MTKWDLIHVALKELIKQWKAGNNLDYFNTSLEYPSTMGLRCEMVIKWDPKLPADSQNRMEIPKAIRIVKKSSGRFACTIVDTTPTPLHSRNNIDRNIEDERDWIWLRKLNRDFVKLYNDIEKYKRLKENSVFLNDLVKMFPRTLDGALLGDDYDE